MNRISKALSDNVLITGDLLLVEEVKNEEVKTKSGLIISRDERQTNGIASSPPTFVRVLAVGPDGTSSVGDILLVGEYSVKYFSTFPGINATENPVGICNERETQIRFKGQEAFEEFKRQLSS